MFWAVTSCATFCGICLAILATRWCLYDYNESMVMAWQIAGYECDLWAACAVVRHGKIMWA